MNGFRQDRNLYGAEPRRPSPPRAPGPSGKVLVEGYRKDVVSNFEREPPRYNPVRLRSGKWSRASSDWLTPLVQMNPDRVQSSVLVDLKDPIQVHLLTETALLDSKKYEVLSQEEVDDLKKQIQSLTQRVGQTRANLVLQSKYRDAAVSMSKLYSPTKPDGKRRSLLGNRNSGETAREAEMERQNSERRCEELASELWTLEKRLMEPQRRLLEHTAGILQLTHKATRKPGPPQNGQQFNGIPGSPESMYAYSNSRSSMEPPPDETYFDDGNVYRSLDDGMQSRRPRKNPIDIPMKSPVREQNNQLREESERLREENGQLREENGQLKAQTDAASLETDALRRENSQQLRVVSDVERKLERLNNSIRGVIVKFNPAKNNNYRSPPYGLTNGSERALEPGDMVASQLDYLERAIYTVRDEQDLQATQSMKEAESEAAAAAVSLAQAEGRVEALNRRIRDLLSTVGSSLPTPPDSSGSALDDQLDYLQDSLGQVETELARATDAAKEAKNRPRDDNNSEVLLRDLWASIQKGFSDMQRAKEERRRNRSEKGIDEDEEYMSADEPFEGTEPYSLQALSSRVKWLSRQVTSLGEQKSVLKRQIKQQRELNNKTDKDKDEELEKRQTELDTTKSFIARAEEEANQAKGMLSQALRDLEEERRNNSDGAANAKTFQDQLKQRNVVIGTLEASNNELEKKLDNIQGSIQELDTELGRTRANAVILENKLEALQEEKEKAEEATREKQKEVEEREAQIKAKEEEIDQIAMTMVELKTELVITKAELDGASGSRSQRAAEAADIIKNSAEVAGLQAEIQKLKDELAETVKELENITKETIGVEREKFELEGKLDVALSNQAELETEAATLRATLTKVQEDLDAEKLKVPDAGTGAKAGAGASMLSEQFRTTMREERKKFQEDLKVRRAFFFVLAEPRVTPVSDPVANSVVAGGANQAEEGRGGARPPQAAPGPRKESTEPAVTAYISTATIIKGMKRVHIPERRGHALLFLGAWRGYRVSVACTTELLVSWRDGVIYYMG